MLIILHYSNPQILGICNPVRRTVLQVQENMHAPNLLSIWIHGFPIVVVILSFFDSKLLDSQLQNRK